MSYVMIRTWQRSNSQHVKHDIKSKWHRCHNQNMAEISNSSRPAPNPPGRYPNPNAKQPQSSQKSKFYQHWEWTGWVLPARHRTFSGQAGVRCHVIIDGEAKAVEFGSGGQNFTRQLTMPRPAWQNNMLKQLYNKQAYNFYLDEVYAQILKSKFWTAVFVPCSS